MERRSERRDTTGQGAGLGLRSDTVVDARTSLALWLRAGRTHRGLSLEAVAKVTKIQPRILERLEAGKLDGLPAEVFVRGFVRSVARCVGLDEDEALRRYAACGLGAGTAELTPTVRALVEAMVDLAPGQPTAPRATPRRMQAVEIIDLASSSGTLRRSDAVVETMMLPETGTVVMPAPLRASMAEARTDSEPVLDAAPVARLTAAIEVVTPVEATPVEATPVEATPAMQIAAVAVEPVSLPAGDAAKKKRTRRGGKGRNKRTGGSDAGLSRDLLAMGTPPEASPIVTAPMAISPVVAAELADIAGEAIRSDAAAGEPCADVVVAAPPSEPGAELVMAAPLASDGVAAPPSEPITSGAMPAVTAADEPIATATWAPKMPPIATTSSVPWRRPAYVASATPVVPSLVIDDADPDSAERVLEARAEHHTPRRSFLPPILMDREDRSGRQGGLTLAVIILLIAATLTLSYLMRRPSAGGDGMTRLEAPALRVGSPARG
jgi:helix-turn-helix protein